MSSETVEQPPTRRPLEPLVGRHLWRPISDGPPADVLVILTDGRRGWLGCKTWVDDDENSGYVYTNLDDPRICWTGANWEFTPDYDDEYRPSHWCPMPDPREVL